MRSAYRRVLVVLAASASSLLSVACSVPIRAGAYAQPGHEFQEYTSFSWDEPGERPTGDPRLDDNPLFRLRVHAAIEWELRIRGIALVEEGGHDPELGRRGRALLVHHHTSIQDHVAVFERDPNPGFTPEDVDAPRVVQYPEATFIVGLVDAQTHELVWSAWATLDFDSALADPGAMQAQIDAAVAAMFERFPLPVGRAAPGGMP